MSESPFICPAPLVVATEMSHTTIVVAADCVVPCPSIDFTSLEWENINKLLKLFVYISSVLSFVSLIAHTTKFKKFFIQVMLIGGFFMNSVGMLLFFSQNDNNEVVCDGPAHYIERGPICVTQATMFTFSFLWVESWSAIFVLDLYLHVTSRVTSHDVPALRERYILCATLFSLILTALPLATDNFGFDPEVSAPFCSYFLSQNDNYFWYSFIIPLTLLIIVDILFAVQVMIKLNQIFVNRLWYSTDKTSSNSSSSYNNSRDGKYGNNRSRNRNRNSSDFELTTESMASVDMQEQYGQTAAKFYNDHHHHHHQQQHHHHHQQHYGSDHERQHDRDTGAAFDATAPAGFGFEFNASIASAPEPSLYSNYNRRGYEAGYSNSFCDGDSFTDNYRITTATGTTTGTTDSTAAVANPMTTNDDSAAVPPPLAAADAAAVDDRVDSADGHPTARVMSDNSTSSAGLKSELDSGFGSVETISSSNVTVVTANNISSPQRWLQYLRGTWRYNKLAITFVVVFCFSSLIVLPMIVNLYHITWDRNVNSAYDFAACLVQASIESRLAGVEQTQESVDSYCAGVCGVVPSDRPNIAFFYTVMLWAAGYGIIPVVIFGFAGYEHLLMKEIYHLCGINART